MFAAPFASQLLGMRSWVSGAKARKILATPLPGTSNFDSRPNPTVVRGDRQFDLL